MLMVNIQDHRGEHEKQEASEQDGRNPQRQFDNPDNKFASGNESLSHATTAVASGLG